MPDQEVDQDKYRRSQVMRDQFGRRWATVIEIKTGDPLGPINPIEWTDPLITPAKYKHVPRDEHGMVMPGRIHIDFDQWIEDLRAGDEDWLADVQEKAQQLYKVISPEAAQNLPNDPYVTRHVGDRPGAWFMHLARPAEIDPETEEVLVAAETAADVIRRAQNMDTDLLGIPEVEEAYQPGKVTWQEFAGQCRREGKSMKEAGVLWEIRKAEQKQTTAA
jgi:hypothetical protein